MVFIALDEKTTSWVSVVPSILWFLFAVGMVIAFWKKLRSIFDAVVLRIQTGAPLAVGPLNIGSPPSGLGIDASKGATAEGLKGAETPADIKQMLLERRYPDILTEDIYLVHISSVIRPYTGPGTGLWRVRVCVEAYEDEALLGEIVRVTYRLHDTFPRKVIATEARDNGFELWMNIYGEFNLIALVERQNKPALWLTRYIDLPGRPTN